MTVTDKQLRLECPRQTCTGTIIVDPRRVGSSVTCPVCGAAARVSKSNGGQGVASRPDTQPAALGTDCERLWHLSCDALVLEIPESELQRRLQNGSLPPDTLLSRDEQTWRAVRDCVPDYVYRPASAQPSPAQSTASATRVISEPETAAAEQQHVHDFLRSISATEDADSAPVSHRNSASEDSERATPDAANNVKRRRRISAPIAWTVSAVAGLFLAALVGAMWDLSTETTTALWCGFGATIYQSLGRS